MLELLFKIKKSFYAKILVSFLIIAFFAPMALPTKADAGGMAVFDSIGAALKTAGNAILTIISTISNAIIGAGIQALVTAKYILGPLATTIAKMILRGITASIIAWISNGFQGSPSFIQDPKRFFTNVADQAIGAVLLSNEATKWMCTPFAINIKRALIYNRSFYQRSQCSLTQVVNNFKGFASGLNNQFGSLGGWTAWNTMTYEPQNNPYGAYALFNMQVDVQVTGAINTQARLLDWGKGFLSWKDPTCVENAKRNSDLEGYKTGDEIVPLEESEGNTISPNTDPNTCPILTPGDVIANQINKTIGSDVDQLVGAQEINQIISALLYQLAVKALGGSGLLGLGASYSDPYGTNGSYAQQLLANDQQVFNQTRSDLNQQIYNRITTENNYSATKNQTLSLIDLSANKAFSVLNCYFATSSTPLGINNSMRATDIAGASSSLAFINGFKRSIQRDVDISDINISNLQRLVDASNALDYSHRDTLQQISSQFSQLITQIHSDGDVINAQFERDQTIPDAMKAPDADNDTRLNRCYTEPIN